MTIQFQPTRTTFWAARNVSAAITLLIIFQVAQILIGFYLGWNALPVFSASSLSFLSVLLAATVYFLQNFYERKKRSAAAKSHFSLIFRGNLLVFLATFAFSLLAGNQFARFHNPAAEPEVMAMVTEEKNGHTDGDSLLREMLAEQQVTSTTHVTTEASDTGQRIGYIALFILSLVLTYAGASLACSLACSNYGFLAVLVVLLGVGIFGGGVYFLLKALRKGRVKRWREMDQAERRKERKRYLITTLAAFGALIVFYLIGINS